TPCPAALAHCCGHRRNCGNTRTGYQAGLQLPPYSACALPYNHRQQLRGYLTHTCSSTPLTSCHPVHQPLKIVYDIKRLELSARYSGALHPTAFNCVDQDPGERCVQEHNH
ncbi:unnamed protein product, partial [Ectocarpus sp. 12 AP-2014]